MWSHLQVMMSASGGRRCCDSDRPKSSSAPPPHCPTEVSPTYSHIKSQKTESLWNKVKCYSSCNLHLDQSASCSMQSCRFSVFQTNLLAESLTHQQQCSCFIRWQCQFIQINILPHSSHTNTLVFNLSKLWEKICPCCYYFQIWIIYCICIQYI